MTCFLAQAADSDYEELGNLSAGPVGTLDFESDPCSMPKTAQENGHISSESQGIDITTYGESNLVAEPQKVRQRQQGIIWFPGYLFSAPHRRVPSACPPPVCLSHLNLLL